MEVCTSFILLILDIKKTNIDQKYDEVFCRWLLNFYILLLFISKHVYNIRMTVYN